jgi:periplasmic protein TonB
MAPPTRNTSTIPGSACTASPGVDLQWSPFRRNSKVRAACMLLSSLVHAAALTLAALLSVNLAEPEAAIPVRIVEPAPPPPPGMGQGPAGLPNGGEPQVIAPPVPVPPRPPAPETHPRELTAKPKNAPRPRIPTKHRLAAKPTPHPAPPPAATSANAAAEPPAAAPRGEPGILGGVQGGMLGGKVGGKIGGRGDLPLRADQVASPPVVIDGVPPIYPPLARMRGMEGLVVVEAIIDRNGRVEGDGLRVTKSNPVFDAAALSAFRQWKFRPGRDANGRAVRVIVDQPIRFQLR